MGVCKKHCFRGLGIGPANHAHCVPAEAIKQQWRLMWGKCLCAFASVCPSADSPRHCANTACALVIKCDAEMQQFEKSKFFQTWLSCWGILALTRWIPSQIGAGRLSCLIAGGNNQRAMGSIVCEDWPTTRFCSGMDRQPRGKKQTLSDCHCTIQFQECTAVQRQESSETEDECWAL